jgi:hypothetical protein
MGTGSEMITLRAPGPNPVRIRPVQPSAALKAWYETELSKLIEPMCEDVAKALLPIWRSAPQPTLFMTFPHGEVKYELAEIEDKWRRKFAEAAPALARGITKRVLEYWDISFADALTKAGIGIPKPAMDGDLPGHGFRGNRYTGGIGGQEAPPKPDSWTSPEGNKFRMLRGMILFKPGMSAAEMDHATVHNLVQRVAPSVGVNPDRVIISDQSYEEFTGQSLPEFMSGATGWATIRSEDPRIYVCAKVCAGMEERSMALILGHESGHIIYEGVRKLYEEEYLRMVKDPRMTTERLTGTLSPEGLPRNGAEEWYPTVRALQPFIEGHSYDLREGAGVTAYAQAWQTAAREKRATWYQAFHEAFAETHSQDAAKTRLRSSKYSPVWDEYHKAVMGVQKSKHLAVDASPSSATHFNPAKLPGTVEMPIEQFLALALPTTTPGGVPEKLGRVRATLARGEKFASTPHLAIVDDKVVGHEGRHRAMVLREMGYSTIPVFLKGAPAGIFTLESQDGKRTVTLGMDAKKDFKKEFRVKFDFTERLRATAQAHIDENVALIHSIPEQFHKRIKRMAWKSIENGRDIVGFTKDLQDEFDITLRRASFIARDQNNKMTVMFGRARRLDLGLDTAIWRHTASLHPREEHIDFDGESYSIEEGMYSEEAGENIWPGTEPNCGCMDETVIPGYEKT